MVIFPSLSLLYYLPFIHCYSPRHDNLYIDHPYPCDIYISISNISHAGRGIFAGRDYALGEWIDNDLRLLLPFLDTYETPQLNDYAFTADGDHSPLYSTIHFGFSTTLNNHRYLNNIHPNLAAYETFKSVNESLLENLPYTNYTDMTWSTSLTRQVRQGEELFSYYGDDWYVSRNLTIAGSCTTMCTITGEQIGDDPMCIDSANRFVDMSYVWWQDNGYNNVNNTNRYHQICLSHITVFASTIDNAGRGLFAKKYFAEGELITVSPVAVLNKTLADESSTR